MRDMIRRMRIAVKDERGFTILELMFVIAIFGIMSSITLFGFRDFAQKTSFDNLAQDIALHIVQAQKAAISGKVNQTVLISSVAPTYGVFFESGSTPSPANQRFTYFNDLPASGGGLLDMRYTAPTGGGCPPSSECISQTKITSGEYIDLISYVPMGGTYTPLASGSVAHITFTRPFPDASIILCTGSAPTDPCTAPLSNVYIELMSSISPTIKKTIVVNGLGEVRVYNGSTVCAYTGGTGC